MNKTKLLDMCAKNPDERIMLAKVLDKLERARNKQNLENTAFLSPAEQASVMSMLRHYGDIKCETVGGFEGAERCVCVFLPDWMYELESEDMPITPIKIAINKMANFGHRDVLGSLMGLGLTREKIGDILINDDHAVVLVLSSTAEIILSQWDSVGRFSVSPEAVDFTEINAKAPELKTIKDTVATRRLDSVVATGFSMSRSKAADYITAGRVAVNHIECVKTDKIVEQGDTITCRGQGKCVLREVIGKSRKDREIIEIDRYV